MSPVEEVATEAGRLATFQEPQQLHKRRASSTKKKSPNSVVWPHVSPSPEDLAHAGFYYKPTSTSNDNVSCFLCSKDFDGWERDDDPIHEHLNLVPDCGWALNVAIAQRIGNHNHQEQDPMSEPLLAARLATFKDAWPHDGKRGWKCTSKKLASAGWTYNPVPEADDCVQCFYCNCSLDGWEPKDDPWEEHHRRNPDCAFFALVKSSNTTKPSRGKKGAKSRASKASRLSSQSTLTTMSDDENNDLSNESVAEEGDTVLTTASKTTGGRKKAAPKKTRATRKTTRSKSVAINHDIEMPDAIISEELDIDAVQAATVPQKAPAKRATRGKKPDIALDSSVVEVEAPEATEPAAKPTRKGRGKLASTAPSDITTATVEHDGTIPPQPKTQRDKKRGISMAEKADTSVISAIDASDAPKAKATHGKKRGSDGVEKTESSILVPAESQRPDIPAKSPKRAAKPVRITGVKEAYTTNGAAGSKEGDEGEVGAAKKSKSTTKAPSLGTALETQLITAGPEPAPQDYAAVDEEKLPQRSPSPQSSDAENQPPSAQLSQRGERVPLAAQTPARPSPSKRNIAGGLVSSSAWQAVDVDAIFSRSPALQAIGQENLRLEDVLKSLSSPEKKMTVEEWMLHNAHMSEDKLRVECERMISLFEGEGNRALQSLEGISVS